MNRLMWLGAGFMGIIKLNGKDRKKAAEWGFLLSVVFIVPLFFMSDASELFKIAMQLMWGGHVYLGRQSWQMIHGRKTNHHDA
ncbi:hypothetical protein LD112_24960 [Pantoea agglomerans]|nr:hypothetical protein [Pantoea agglomerans]